MNLLITGCICIGISISEYEEIYTIKYDVKQRFVQYSNLQSTSLRCGTRLNKWGAQ